MLYEMHIYHAIPKQLPNLNKRFDTITLKVWNKFSIRQVSF